MAASEAAPTSEAFARYERAQKLAREIETLIEGSIPEADPRVRYELRLAQALARSLVDQLGVLPRRVDAA